MKMMENLLKKTPAFIWHIKHWYLMTYAWVIDQICKQTVTISVFWALEALFVDEKVFLLMKMIKKWLKKTPAIIWHIKHWCLILFSSTNKDSRAVKTEIVTVCLQIWSITAGISHQISMFVMSNEGWSLLQSFFYQFH